MRMTLKNKLSLCLEILGSNRFACERHLTTFQKGHEAGVQIERARRRAEVARVRHRCARKAIEVLLTLSEKEAKENIERAVLNA